jgi:hypothetical protein
MTSIKETVERLTERASVARSEGTGTALGDAVHFEEAIALIERLAGALEEIKSADDQDVWLRGRAHRALSGEPTP